MFYLVTVVYHLEKNGNELIFILLSVLFGIVRRVEFVVKQAYDIAFASLQTDENSFLLRLKIIGAFQLAKKDIFGAR